jgi:arsenite/tail-anchored protein-transporting ATPase
VSALDALLGSLPRTALIVGKGGVGKTTCAAGIAALYAERGQRTLLISTDPAAALADVIGSAVETRAGAVPAFPSLDAWQLSSADLRTQFLAQWRDTIADIVDRGTYLDRADVDGLVDSALPGVDEIFALLAIADLLADPASPYERIIIDTAPTGHTLRLLAMPETFRALLSMLDAMQAKHRFMVRALTHRYRRDRADEFLDDMRARIERLRATLADAQQLAAVLVTRPGAIVAAESARYIDDLKALHIRVAAMIVNAVAATDPGVPVFDDIPPIWLRREPNPPKGLDSIVAMMRRATPEPPRVKAAKKSARSPASTRPAGSPAHLLRTVTIVGGKGGVGKSTVACALGVAASDDLAGTTLLVSTDPAPSIADAFGESDADWAKADVEANIDGLPRLVVRQMDASAAFARIRDTYQSRIDALFENLMGRGVDVAADRAIVRDLLALAPPGIDELFALSILGDALAEQRFARIIVDPAPTGHLLRLVEMPAVALEWTHRLMRLMLKYRDVVGLGDTAQELIDFAKRTRALDALLHDHSRAGLIIVSLDEPVVRSETVRLASAVRARGIDVTTILWNRVPDSVKPLPATVATRQFCAEEVQPPPVGVPALREWSRSWHTVSPLS